MLALSDITPLHWGGFIAAVLVLLALDLGVFHKEGRVVSFKEALGWSVLWFSLALCFAWGLVPFRGREEAVEFITGYVIELSLSMDNVFVIALIFAYFRVPAQYQHRVLFWGILGALVMRGVMIGLGTAVIARFQWLLYLMGAFLVYSGFKVLCTRDEGVEPEKNPFIKLARKFFPITPEFEGQRFLSRVEGRRALTPLALVLVMVETTDLVFAVDSIPAIFAITLKPFIIFTSNVFAILGLRSLYFVLAGAIRFFRFLKAGLSLVLIFIGLKMLLMYFQIHIATGVSLGVVASIIITSILLSVVASRRTAT